MKYNLNQIKTLPEMQHYCKNFNAEMGWNKNSHLEIFLLLSEEFGELAQSIRYYTKLYTPESKAIDKNELALEMADVLNYLIDLANYFEIDLLSAFQQKNEENKLRSWEQ